MENNANIPIPLRIRATLRRRVRESTHISNQSWLSTRYPRRSNIQTERVRFTFNNNKYIIHQQNLTTINNVNTSHKSLITTH